MPTQPIKMTDLVTVELTGYGGHVLDEHLGPGRPSRKPGEPHRRVTRGPFTLPLWEVMQIFGPAIRLSLKLPIDTITFERERSEDERRRFDYRDRARAHESCLRGVLEVLMPSANAAYSAPELLAEMTNTWLTNRVPAVPTEPGLWWLEDGVVRVARSVTPDGSLARNPDGSFCLVAILRNNRRKPVGDLEGWGGPACRDPRVPAPKGEAEEDIPF